MDYLFSQRGVLYFRMRVPKELQASLGQKEYRRSLGTPSRREARFKALKLALALSDIFTCIREQKHMDHVLQQQRNGQRLPLTATAIKKIAHTRLDQCLQERYEYRLLRGFRTAEEQENEQDGLEYCLLDTLERIDAGEIPQHVTKIADNLLEEHGLDNPKAAEDPSERLPYLHLCDTLLRADAAILESELAGPCWNGSLRRAKDWSVSMAEVFIEERTHQQPQQEAWENADTPPLPSAVPPGRVEDSVAAALEKERGTPTIKEAVDKFIEERSPGWERSTAMDTPKRLHTFLSIIGGENLTFAAFSRNRDAIRRYRHVMANIPAQYAKKREWRGLDWDALVALQVAPGMRFKGETLKNHFNTIRGFLTWAEDEGYLRQSRPFKKILVELPAEAERSKKRSFTHEELVRIFSPETFLTRKTGLDAARPWKFFAPVMGLFTGARIEELCQLDLADIRQEPGQTGGVWYLHITDDSTEEGGENGRSTKAKSVKTSAGIRKVPLHPFLLGMNGSPVNILEYAERLKARGETRLFPMLKGCTARGNYSDAVTKWFTRYRRACGVGGMNSELRTRIHNR